MYCECGCGELAPIAEVTRRNRGWIRGQPKRFLNRHNARIMAANNRAKYALTTESYTVEDRGHKTPCWIWQGRLQRGYARTQPGYVHRTLYIEKYGTVPDGLVLDHLCQVTACINPDHLEPVTHAINIQRGSRAKLKLAEVEIIRLLLLFYPQSRIAKQYGVCYSTIANIAQGKAWR